MNNIIQVGCRHFHCKTMRIPLLVPHRIIAFSFAGLYTRKLAIGKLTIGRLILRQPAKGDFSRTTTYLRPPGVTTCPLLYLSFG
jgi:hypothetical protein